MTERDLIVRCPGCGNGKVITLAVGQLLQCDICRTTFHAPIAEDGSASPEALTDSFVVGRAAEPDGPDPAAADVDDDVDGPSAPQSDFGSDSQVTPTRSWRTHDLELGASSDSTGPIAVRADEPAAAKGHDDLGEPSGLAWNLVAMISVGIIVTAVVLVGYVVVRNLPSAGGDRLSRTEGRSKSSNVPWTDASRFSQRQENITLKIERVIYGALRAKDLSHQVITTEDDNLLGIIISVKNRGNRPRPFRNWYGHAFVDQDGVELLAELSDDQGETYSLLKFDDVSYIEGQKLADAIGLKDPVQDTVVFLIPVDVDRAAIKYFRLSLPGAAVGLGDFFRFQIPVDMIEGFEANEADRSDVDGPG